MDSLLYILGFFLFFALLSVFIPSLKIYLDIATRILFGFYLILKSVSIIILCFLFFNYLFFNIKTVLNNPFVIGITTIISFGQAIIDLFKD